MYIIFYSPKENFSELCTNTLIMSYAGHVLDAFNRLKYSNYIKKHRREEYKNRTSKKASISKHVYTYAPKEISKEESEKIKNQEIKRNRVTVIKTLLLISIMTLITILLIKIIFL